MIGSDSELSEQLVVELTVRDLDHSLALYTALGFTLERRDGSFAALRWGDRRLFLDERRDVRPVGAPMPSGVGINIRILVPEVDRLWAVAGRLGLVVERPIGDRAYGLRDFTVLDPDGFGLRFASRLPEGAASHTV